MLPVGPAVQISDFGREIGRGAAEAVGEKVVQKSSNFVTDLFSSFGFSDPAVGYGVVFGVVGVLGFLFYWGSRQPKPRPAPVVDESRQETSLRMEWYLLDAHQKYARGEISRAQFQELMMAHQELVRNMMLLRGESAGPPPAPVRAGGVRPAARPSDR